MAIHAALAATLNHAYKSMAIVTNAKLDIGETGVTCHVIQVVKIPAARQLLIVFAKMDTMEIRV